MNSLCHERNRREFHNFHEMHDCPEEVELLVLESSTPRNRQTGVSPNIKFIKLVFGPGLDRACSIEVDMWKGSTKVPIRVKENRDRCFRTNVIKVFPIHSLDGGTLFKVRVKAFFVDHCGETIKKVQMISFTTGCK
ncbi:MAG: hypothetical protein ABFC94_18140 [Syntrophomonas sp.]